MQSNGKYRLTVSSSREAMLNPPLPKGYVFADASPSCIALFNTDRNALK